MHHTHIVGNSRLRRTSPYKLLHLFIKHVDEHIIDTRRTHFQAYMLRHHDVQMKIHEMQAIKTDLLLTPTRLYWKKREALNIGQGPFDIHTEDHACLRTLGSAKPGVSIERYWAQRGGLDHLFQIHSLASCLPNYHCRAKVSYRIRQCAQLHDIFIKSRYVLMTPHACYTPVLRILATSKCLPSYKYGHTGAHMFMLACPLMLVYNSLGKRNS